MSVNSVSTWTWSLDRDLEFWREHGYRHVGLLSTKLGDTAAASAKVQGDGLSVSSLAVTRLFTLGEPANWPGQQERACSLVRTGQSMGAACVYMNAGSSASRMTVEDSVEAFCTVIAPVAELAQTLGVRLAIEPSAATNHDTGCVHSLADAFYVADRTGIDVVVDLQTGWLERRLVPMVRDHLDQVALIQVNDYVVGTEVRLSRVVPGDGDIPLARLIGGILQAGYQGAFDLEILGPRIEEEGYISAVPRGAQWLSACLTELGA
jgi:sugar phosphate isomerase/epimerase